MSEHLQPTDEQKAILEDRSRVLLINARAGTGKTTTLRLLATKRPDRSFLYLVFNRKARLSAKKTFPPNVTVHTIHSLAFQQFGYRWGKSLRPLTPIDFLPLLAEHDHAHRLAGLCRDFLTYFLNSPWPCLEEAAPSFLDGLNEPAASFFRARREIVVQTCRTLAIQWNRRTRPCPHDFYLKLFHLQGHFQRALSRYDTVLVDEAQDLSPVMVDALKGCPKRLVIVGDAHQQIYGFRHAVNAMKQLSPGCTLELTQSFRFGSPIADFTRWLVRTLKEDDRFQISGNPTVRSRVRLSRTAPARGCALLCRSNLALFSQAIALHFRERPFRFERDIKPIVYSTLDVFYLFSGNREQIRDPWIRSFADFEALKRYGEEHDDYRLQTLTEIVARHYRSFPGIVFDMVNSGTDHEEADPQELVTLGTVHSAKGQEYDRVWIHGDVAQNVAAKASLAPALYEQEANVAYVAATRARRDLFLAADFLQIDGLDDWYAEQLRKDRGTPSPKKRTSPGKNRHRARRLPSAARSSASPSPARAANEAVTAGFKTGDRVLTSHGPARIVEMGEMQCWVELEGGSARVRQWLATLKPNRE